MEDMLFFLVTGAGLLCCALVLIWLMRVLKRQKDITKNWNYKDQFSSRQPKVSMLVNLIPMFAAGFMIFVYLLIADIDQLRTLPLTNQLLPAGLLLFCLCVVVISLLRIIGGVRKHLSVDGEQITFTNGRGKTYHLTPKDIVSMTQGTRYRGASMSGSVWFTFYDETGKKHHDGMYLYLEPSLQMGRWQRRFGDQFRSE